MTINLCNYAYLAQLVHWQGFGRFKRIYGGSLCILCKYSVKHWWKRKLGPLGLLIVLITLWESLEWKIKYFILWYGVKRLLMVQLGLIRTKCLRLSTTRFSIKWKSEIIMPWYILKRGKLMELGLVGPISTLIAFRPIWENIYWKFVYIMP